ncbi:hypothetical protein NA57DRAFT_72620 [Rhizodiscina lignyota]|uniref:MYND-type domain-containing protein n=1 Tax=Rhizodiscina lignyota TaxID=1504668 RepID=A0A9P4IMI2_9PEZI|nr:hypothetical protein NA57DRAFT_72620 [Rhizodiscina lignyota]
MPNREDDEWENGPSKEEDDEEYDDEDEDGDDDEDDELAGLMMDGVPIELVDTKDFNEDVDTKPLTAAHGIATCLYNLHPNALRAFLDTDKYNSVEWGNKFQYSKKAQDKGALLIIARNDRVVTFGTYLNMDDGWECQASFGIKEDGSWKPISGYIWGDAITNPTTIRGAGRNMTVDVFHQKRWKKSTYGTAKITLDINGKRTVNPHWLYQKSSAKICTYCKKKPEKLLQCSRCRSTWYCSKDCQTHDWDIHRNLCEAPQNQEHETIGT